ncbi:hypothetical protein GCM10010172_38630 [Paractinoplanes ferrugineus]|uniref:Uncharacterized protein n=1 Tax=Paractinoplanes ferrugineus TaxID=113564 RepID=A0A919J4Z1_9ACTN|nr:hypothetical protein Afe05nite_44790 [Actinoplanes ferrugineus]
MKTAAAIRALVIVTGRVTVSPWIDQVVASMRSAMRRPYRAFRAGNTRQMEPGGPWRRSGPASKLTSGRASRSSAGRVREITAGKVVIVPGYRLADAQAQPGCVAPAEALTERVSRSPTPSTRSPGGCRDT